MRPLALVVENDTGTRKLLDVLLSRHGCDVDVAVNGLDALLLLERIDYDLTIFDLLIPGAGGVELLDWLRVNRPASLPRAALLSSAPPAQFRSVQDAFAEVRMIRKPFELRDIIELAERALRTPHEASLDPVRDFTRRSISAGAKAGVLVRNSGGELSLVHQFGYQEATIAAWFPLAANDPFPLCRCVSDARPLWFASLTEAAAEFPQLLPYCQQNDSFALASVPLVRDGEVIGAAGWAFREPHLFDEREQRAFLTIAAAAAAALQTTAGVGA